MATTAEAHVLLVIQNLLESTSDTNENVINAIKSSLYKLSDKYPNDILKTAYDYHVKTKLQTYQMTQLLEIIAHISSEHTKHIDGDVVLNLIEFSVHEMIKANATVHNEEEQRASDILVALGKHHCIQVMEGLMKKVVSGTIPHYMIIHTLGSLALTNCYGTVPYVKSLLTKMLPITSMLKFDHHKQAFAYALGSISYAVTEYLSNIQKAPDPTLSKETFYSEFTIAYDVLITSWLSSREPKVLESVLQALSTLIPVLPADKIAEQIPRIVPQLFSMYKQRYNTEPIYVTKCICSILSATPPKNRTILEIQLDDIVHHLVDQIIPEQPDYVQLESLKNHSEILRCFDVLFSYFPFKMIENLSQQLKNNNEVIKLKSLIVVCHMMNTSDEALKAQLKAFVPILKHLLTDINFRLKHTDINWSDTMGGFVANRSKKVMLKIIVLLTYHRFITDDDLTLFLNYIVKLCCLQWSAEKLNDMEHLERLEFKRVCDNSMYLLTTSSTDLESQLWSLYLDCFVNMEYKAAACSLVRCLSYLANKFKDTPEKLTADAKITTIFIRSLSLLAMPLNNYQGTYVLNFLKNFAPYIDNKIILLWDKRVAEILKFLEYTSDNFDANEWELIIIQFLIDTIIQIGDEKWTLDIIDKCEKQVLLYSIYTPEKGFTLLCLASALTHITDTNVIEAKIDAILCLTRSEQIEEVQICSKMIKTMAKIHLKCILKKLQELSKVETRKSTKFFGLLKDSRNDFHDKIKMAILMCYGEIATIDTAANTLNDFQVLQYAVSELRNTKVQQIRVAALKTIKNITETFHQNRNMITNIMEYDRNQILFTILELLYENTTLAPNILETATALIKLSPVLKSGEKTKVFKLCFENSTQILGHGHNLLILIIEILLQSITPAILEEIFCLLQMLIIERDGKQRLCALNMFKSILSTYLEHLHFDTSTTFELTGFIIGCLIPRLNDPIIEIRIETIHCINLILKIASKYEGTLESDDLNTDTLIITIMKSIQNVNDEEMVKDGICDYARIISTKMSHFQLMNFTESMLNGLLDVEMSSAYGVTFVLDSFLKVKGGDMFHYVEDMVFKIISVVEKINYADVKLAALKSIATLASHHPKAVITTLLIQPLGYETCIPECWRILTEDQVLASAALSHFIRLISGSAVYDEQVSRDRMRIAMHQPLAAISAISDMFCWHTQMEELSIAQFPEIFSILYISLASYMGVSAPIAIPTTTQSQQYLDKFNMIPNRNAYKLNPTKIACEAFKTFLICAKCEHIAEHLFTNITTETTGTTSENILIFINIVPKLMFTICSTMYHVVPKLLTNLSSYRSSTYEPQRIAVYAFYCEYIHQRAHIDIILLESTVCGLLEGQTDTNPIVRELSLRGLGYLANHNETLITRYTTSILNAFMNGLDEHKIGLGLNNNNNNNNNNIPLESLNGLYNILPILDDEQFIQIQINTGLRIKPFFESDYPELRAAAIQLFGRLIILNTNNNNNNNISNKHFNILREQVNNNLICFLLHLSDTNINVVKACNTTLRNVVPILNTKKFNSLIQDHLIDEAKLNYNTFMPALIKTMAIEIPETFSYLLMSSLTYLKSKCPVIRGNTAFIIGLLCNNLPKDDDVMSVDNNDDNDNDNNINHKSLETVSNRLITLLKDNDANVRAKTAYALSYL